MTLHNHQAGKATDRVCGMSVDMATAANRLVHQEQEFFFCSAGCKQKFAADPQSFLSYPSEPSKRLYAHSHSHGNSGAPVSGDKNAIYTCPMHPEIRQQGPGSCPICGMALEPLHISRDSAPDAELTDMSRRLWIALPLAILVSALDMGMHIFHLDHVSVMGIPFMNFSGWAQLVLATPVVLWAGAPFFARGWRSLVTRHLNMFTLIALGTGVAYFYSLVALTMPGLFPDLMRGNGPALYFEAASVITVLVLLGQVLELRARAKTGGAIRALLNLAPKTARRVDAQGADHEVALDAVRKDDVLRIRPGEAVPVDGIIVEGKGLVDQSMLTGESEPVGKGPNESVIGGTLNRSGSFLMKASAVGEETMLARIVGMVASAQRSRAPIQSLADKVAGYFVPAVVVVALVAFAAWMIWSPAPQLPHALLAAVSVLIIACPCALGLATPMSIMVAMGKGAQKGILLRNAGSLETLEKIDTLVIDKTGTLTEGRPRLLAIEPTQGFNENDLLRLAASIERSSEHSLAVALVAEAEARGLALSPVGNFKNVSGKGVSGDMEGRKLSLGNNAFFNDLGIAVGESSERADALRANGATVILIAVDGRFAGLAAIADPVKHGAAKTLQSLRKDGVRIIMLTGDHHHTAEAVGRELGITEIEAGILPDRKQEIVARLRGEGAVVAMAGDGINDAPALAAADVGIAMGGGTDIAMESAGVTLLKGDLALILAARRLSRATMRNIRQNLFFAFAYNTLGVPIAAGLLYPAFGILLSPIFAAAAMSLSSVSVIGNALRLRAIKL